MRISSYLIFSVLVLGVVACGDDGGNGAIDSSILPSDDANVVIDGSVDSAVVDAAVVDSAVVDAAVVVPAALFAFNGAGGAPVGWLDVDNLASDRVPDLTLWDLNGGEAQSLACHGGKLIVATDTLTQPVLVWDDPRGVADGAMPDITITDSPFGGRVTSGDTFTTSTGDIWLVDSSSIWRVVNGTGGGTTAVGFATSDVSVATVVDAAGDTLFAAPDGSSMVAWENVSTMTGTANASTWTFSASIRVQALTISANRLFAGLNAGSGGGPVLQIWNGVSTLSGPTEPVADVVRNDLSAFSGYRSLVVTVDDFLIGVYDPGSGIPALFGGPPPRELHVYAGASTMTSGTVPSVISHASLAGLDNIVVSAAGTLYGNNGSQIVVVPSITTTPGTPFTIAYSADAVCVVQ